MGSDPLSVMSGRPGAVSDLMGDEVGPGGIAQADIARHVIQRSLNPRRLSKIAPMTWRAISGRPEDKGDTFDSPPDLWQLEAPSRAGRAPTPGDVFE